MCINNTSHLYPIKRSNNRTLFVGNTKFTLGRTKIAIFNSAKTFKITNSETLISYACPEGGGGSGGPDPPLFLDPPPFHL